MKKKNTEDTARLVAQVLVFFMYVKEKKIEKEKKDLSSKFHLKFLIAEFQKIMKIKQLANSLVGFRSSFEQKRASLTTPLEQHFGPKSGTFGAIKTALKSTSGLQTIPIFFPHPLMKMELGTPKKRKQTKKRSSILWPNRSKFCATWCTSYATKRKKTKQRKKYPSICWAKKIKCYAEYS